MVDSYAREVGARLRSIRQQQGLTLHGMEEKSQGRWKASVVGSYERGIRSMTVVKLAEIAAFYKVPVNELMPGASYGSGPFTRPTDRITVDLERLSQLDEPEAAPLARYAATIQLVRADLNGNVLTLQGEDMRALAVIYDLGVHELAERLLAWGLVNVEDAARLSQE